MAQHTRAYYEKRGLEYTMGDLTPLENLKINLEKQGKTYNQYLYEEQLKIDKENDDFTDYCKALLELQDGYKYPIGEDNIFYNRYLEIREKYRNGEDISNEI